jgi:guanine deaminase
MESFNLFATLFRELQHVILRGICMTRLAIKGNLAYTPDLKGFSFKPGNYLLVENEKIVDIREDLPENWLQAPLLDYGDCLIIPGLVDLHVHAAQFGYRGLGLDMELLPWLNTYTFPEEEKFADPSYAEAIYRKFADALSATATTRAIAWGTIHASTGLLFAELSRVGLGGWIGKVNMDRNSSSSLIESTQESYKNTADFIQRYRGKYEHLQPVITPRFIPSCSDGLLEGLGRLSVEQRVPVTSHLSENIDEIKWVKELVPQSQSYAQAYDIFQQFGQSGSCVMAHCVHPDPSDFALMRQRQVTVAHCPSSNLNLISGLAPVRQFLNEGVQVGLGTDIAGGYSLSIFDAMVDAIHVSKMYHQYVDEQADPLTVNEAFYLGTKGGGQIMGPSGSFEPGLLADIVVIDDQTIGGGNHFSLQQRLERLVYLSKEARIAAKFLGGRKIG